MTRDTPDSSAPVCESWHSGPVLERPVSALATHSRLAQRLRRRYAALLGLLPSGPPTAATLAQAHAALDAMAEFKHQPGAALRVLRQLTMERVLTLDCEQGLALNAVTQAMTALAELALDCACRHAFAQLDERHGPPLTTRGERAQFWVVGMGKLGARELNVSSDIDLVYVFDHDGETQGTAHGRGRVSCRDYFAQVAKIIHTLVGETTEHGLVFRLDLALRPEGNAGPTVVSLGALEDYLHAQGCEWERFAWLKSRVVAPQATQGSGSAQALRPVVLPFVFRRYLDYGVFDALRQLHQQIRQHAARRSAGHPERANDVKLSRGGIREIEFTVQLLQVVRGGQFPELRTRPTLGALQRLARAGLMAPETADALASAYVFLRQVEHRIQYLDDRQTHVLPTDDADLEWIAETLGLPDCCAFLTQLNTHRETVAQEFDRLLGGAAERDCKGCNGNGTSNGSAPDEATSTQWQALLAQCPDRLRERLQLWPHNPKLRALRDGARARLLRLAQQSLRWLAQGRTHEEAVLRLIDWLESVLRRESYLALLLERPAVHERLLHLLGAARWPAHYLLRHPGVIDELAGPAMLAERFDAVSYMQELDLRANALHRTGEDDEEALLNVLRRAHHGELFRTLARDLEGRLPLEQVADDLSALADATLAVSARWCWQRLKLRHREEPLLAIIGYGKLGGKELGYGSDLDLVFIHQDSDPRAPEIYAAFTRKLINWLTVKTAQGDLYEIDTALRPNGNAGLLVTSLQAFADYQQQRGSNAAWTWEHQAMTRARCVWGGPTLEAGFDAVRRAVISAPREPAALRAEIRAMRQRLYAAYPTKAGRFDLKHSPGGMLDAEFAVQAVVLLHSAQHPGLADNVGNISLLLRAQAAGLLAPHVGTASADAYRALRLAQHRARLNEEPTTVAGSEWAPARQAVLALWANVFTSPEKVAPS